MVTSRVDVDLPLPGGLRRLVISDYGMDDECEYDPQWCVVSGLVYMILYQIGDFLLLSKYPKFLIPQSSKNVQMFRLTRRDAARGHRTELREISEGALADMGRWRRNDGETEQNMMGDKKTRHMGFDLYSWRLFCYCIFFSKGRVLVSVFVCLFFPACD